MDIEQTRASLIAFAAGLTPPLVVTQGLIARAFNLRPDRRFMPRNLCDFLDIRPGNFCDSNKIDTANYSDIFASGGNELESHKRRLGEKIRKRREACGFETQSDFANKLGVDQSRVSNWETGLHLPDRHYRLLIQKYLKVSDEFFDPEAEPAPPDAQLIFDYVKALESKVVSAELRALPADLPKVKRDLIDAIVAMPDTRAKVLLRGLQSPGLDEADKVSRTRRKT